MSEPASWKRHLNDKLVEACRQDDLTRVKILLAGGADPSCYGGTPVAASFCSAAYQVFEYLLQSGYGPEKDWSPALIQTSMARLQEHKPHRVQRTLQVLLQYLENFTPLNIIPTAELRECVEQHVYEIGTPRTIEHWVATKVRFELLN